MATHRFVVLLVAASFVSAAIASPQAASDKKKDEISNTIPLEVESKASSPSTEAESSTSSTTTTTTSKPEVKASPRPPNAFGSGFSRFISDIFQIPISVLRAVNSLLTNPFNRDASATAPKKTDQ